MGALLSRCQCKPLRPWEQEPLNFSNVILTATLIAAVRDRARTARVRVPKLFGTHTRAALFLGCRERRLAAQSRGSDE
jgi:hypothetical protein